MASMRTGFYSAVSLIVLLAVLSMGIAPIFSAPVAAQGPPPCCAHDQAKPDAAPVCPTVECPHCAVLSVELHETLTCCAILNVALNRFPFSAKNPPETFPTPPEYPPKA
jgi:hypothetical protein